MVAATSLQPPPLGILRNRIAQVRVRIGRGESRPDDLQTLLALSIAVEVRS